MSTRDPKETPAEFAARRRRRNREMRIEERALRTKALALEVAYFRRHPLWGLFDGRFRDALAALCEQVAAAGWQCIHLGFGACYFRMPSGRRLRVADHPPLYDRSLADVRVHSNR